MYDATGEILDRDILAPAIHKFAITVEGAPLSYADALELWQHDDAFRSLFISILSDSKFSAYRWETPPITNDTLNRRFEFVLLDSPGLARTPDKKTCASHFANADDDGIVVFENLGKDATLVVPAPFDFNSSYDHLAAFSRSAPDSQNEALWRIVGQTMQRMISDRPLWLSTAGGGVAWLHVRLDSRPKYYGYAPYREFL